MRLFRVILYAGLAIGIIGTWEFVRDDFKSTFEQKVVADKLEVEKVETQSSEKKAEENIQKNEINNTNKSEPVSDIKTADTKTIPNSESKLSFEKGFAEVASGAMHSVVNVATMQVVEDEKNEFPTEMFKGTPFDDILKDFFGNDKKENNKKKNVKKVNALGSGFIVKVTKDKAYIVTNNHVVEKAKKIVIFLSDKTELPAELHAVDQRTDIAILAVNTDLLRNDVSKLKPITWGDSDELNEGNWVIAIGNPFGFGTTITHGIVSAKGRNIAQAIAPADRAALSFVDDFLQHSAPINLGNSGGCLIDVHGRVIGINNAIFSTSGGNIGIGFAIPSNIAKTTVEQLIEHKRTFRGWLGAEVQLVTSKQAESVGLTEKTLDTSKIFGAFIARVTPGGPAEKAGIKSGDIIIEFDGKKISEKSSLQKIVGNTKIGASVKAKIWRQKKTGKWGDVVILDVAVGDFEKAMEQKLTNSKTESEQPQQDGKTEENIDTLGITISSINNLPTHVKSLYSDNVKVVVTKVYDPKDSFSMQPYFVEADGIINVDGTEITSVAQFKELIEKIKKDPSKKGKLIPFILSRNKGIAIIATTIDSSEAVEPEKEKEQKEEKNVEKKEAPVRKKKK